MRVFSLLNFSVPLAWGELSHVSAREGLRRTERKVKEQLRSLQLSLLPSLPHPSSLSFHKR